MLRARVDRRKHKRKMSATRHGPAAPPAQRLLRSPPLPRASRAAQRDRRGGGARGEGGGDVTRTSPSSVASPTGPLRVDAEAPQLSRLQKQSVVGSLVRKYPSLGQQWDLSHAYNLLKRLQVKMWNMQLARSQPTRLQVLFAWRITQWTWKKSFTVVFQGFLAGLCVTAQLCVLSSGFPAIVFYLSSNWAHYCLGDCLKICF